MVCYLSEYAPEVLTTYIKNSGYKIKYIYDNINSPTGDHPDHGILLQLLQSIGTVRSNSSKRENSTDGRTTSQSVKPQKAIGYLWNTKNI